MKKRFAYPIWKFEKMEKELTILEQSGWRLDKIKGMRSFEFVKSTPKTVQYFFTFSITREKLNMNLINDSLIQNFNANQIKESFLGGLGGISVFRITKTGDLSEQRLDRDIILYYYLLKRLVWGILFFLLLFLPLTIGIILNAQKFFSDMNTFYWVFIVGYFALTVSYSIYNMVGFIYQKKKLAKR